MNFPLVHRGVREHRWLLLSIPLLVDHGQRRQLQTGSLTRSPAVATCHRQRERPAVAAPAVGGTPDRGVGPPHQVWRPHPRLPDRPPIGAPSPPSSRASARAAAARRAPDRRRVGLHGGARQGRPLRGRARGRRGGPGRVPRAARFIRRRAVGLAAHRHAALPNGRLRGAHADARGPRRAPRQPTRAEVLDGWRRPSSSSVTPPFLSFPLHLS